MVSETSTVIESTVIDDGERSLELQAMELIASGAPLATILEGLAQAGASCGGARACLILVDQGTGRLRIGGSAGLGAEHPFALEGTPIAFDGGPCGRAAWLGQVVVADGTDVRSAEVRLSVRLGGTGCWAVPLPPGNDRRCAGAMLVIGDQAGAPADQRAEVARLAALVTIALGRDRDQAELLHRAGHDRLTGLVNRTVFLDRLGVALARTPSPASVAVLVVDLNGFRAVNDSMGHDIGDRVLMALADRLRRTMPRGDAVGRLGADEFVVLCDGGGAGDEAMTVARRVTEIVAKPLVLLGREVFVTASVGVALGDDKHRPEEVLRDAATAAAGAKNHGPNHCELFREPPDPAGGSSPEAGLHLLSGG